MRVHSTQDAATADPPEQKVYRTGSNLPVRDPEPGSTMTTLPPSAIQAPSVPSLNRRPGG